MNFLILMVARHCPEETYHAVLLTDENGDVLVDDGGNQLTEG